MTGTLHSSRNPYVGPRAFQRGETLYGRDREVAELLDLLIAERIVLLHSPSGAGKTSLIQAALIPELEAEQFAVLPVLRVGVKPSASDEPSQLPTAELARLAVNRYILNALLSLEDDLPPEAQLPLADLAPLTLGDYLDRRAGDLAAVRGAAGLTNGDLVLVFDQFEEILTVDPTDVEEKAEFFAQVGAALRDRERWALFAMREEYLAGLDPYVRLVPTRLVTTYRLELLGVEAALLAVQEPARQAGVAFAEGSAVRLVDDLRRVRVQQPDGITVERPGPCVEPVQLQVVCRRLWDGLPAGATKIDESAVGDVGDVDTALAGYYADQVAAAAANTGVPERAIREWVDRQLITEQGIRGQVLQGAKQSQGLDNQAVWLLVDAHLVRAERQRGATWFELAHDRLIGPVQADNAAWWERNLSPLQRQAALWDEQGRPDGLLLRDQALVAAEAWASAGSGELTTVERDFLEVSRQDQQRTERERRQTRRIRWLAVGAVLFGVIAVVLAVVAWGQLETVRFQRSRAVQAEATAEAIAVAERDARRAADAARETAVAEGERAEQQRRVAQSRALAAQSQAVFLDAPQRSLLLAVEATTNILQAGDPRVPAAEQALRDALGQVGGVALAGHEDGVTSVAFSPDGRWLATGSWDGTARLWDVSDLLNPGRPAGDPAGSEPGAGPLVLPGHDQGINAVAFSPDGRWLATGSEDATARLWDVSALLNTGLQAGDPANCEPLVLRGHDNRINSIAFSPDGRWLATGSGDATTRLWDLQATDPVGSEPLVLPSNEDAVYSVAFSPDGRWLATGGDASTMRLWDLRAGDPAGSKPGAEAMVLPGNDLGVNSVAFSPDGRWLAAGSWDGTARLWDVSDLLNPGQQPAGPGAEPLVLRGHDRGVSSVAFSPDGRWLATGSWDDTARLWDVSALLNTGLQAAVPASSEPGIEPLVLRGHEDGVTSVAFSRDGHRLATGSWDDTARVWDVSALLNTGLPAGELGTGTLVLPGHDRVIFSVTFSPDGLRLAIGSLDAAARVWDLQTGDPANSAPLVLRGHQFGVNSVAFSPDGRWLATGSDDGTARLWDLQAKDPTTGTLVLPEHEGVIFSVAYSPDGRWLATGSDDGTARLWDVSALLNTGLQAGDLTTGTLVLRGHDRGVTSVAFSPDGRWLATGSGDATARLWDLQAADPAAKPLVLPGHGDLVFSVAFSPDGRWLATGSGDDTARLWDVSALLNTGLQAGGPATATLVLRGHEDGVNAVAFSPDGRWLATGSEDDTARLWDLQAAVPPGSGSGVEALVLRGHDGGVTSVAFSPDGRRLATGSADGTTRLWSLDLDQLVALACRTAGRNLTPEEWAQYLGADEPYRKTCPDLPEGK